MEEDVFCMDVTQCHLRGVYMIHLNLRLKEAFTFEMKYLRMTDTLDFLELKGDCYI